MPGRKAGSQFGPVNIVDAFAMWVCHTEKNMNFTQIAKAFEVSRPWATAQINSVAPYMASVKNIVTRLLDKGDETSREAAEMILRQQLQIEKYAREGTPAVWLKAAPAPREAEAVS